MDIKVRIFLLCSVVTQVISFPQTVTPQSSFVVSSTLQNDKPNVEDTKEGEKLPPPTVPKIYEMRIDSTISNRFAKTLVTSKVRNLDEKAHEAVFSVILPEKAFISKFVMMIDGKDYEAYIKEKEEAKDIYDKAVASGLGAAHVAANARDSNRFTVSVNVEPQSKAVFYLTYEELLERHENQYELVLNIHPKQPVKDLFVKVNINESQPLTFVRAPAIRSGNDISTTEGDLDPRADIQMLNSTSATVQFSPNLERQKQLAKTLGTDDSEGLSGQFVVQYDVERSSNGGEILLQDGYFVHFFAPTELPPLPKHVLFVLDTSGSMYGTKIEQLKTAMKSILGELKEQDLFHLIDFNSLVKVLNLNNKVESVTYPSTEPGYYYVSSTEDQNRNQPEDISAKQFPEGYSVNPDNIKKANEIVNAMEANGGTNIHDALKVALHLVNVEKRKNVKQGPQPIIIFLTDGDATVGITESKKIIAAALEQNIYSVPIFSLSFGDGADRSLLQKLSLRNNGFARHIYEAADASLQLQDFYKQISSPLLRNVSFKYVDDAKDLTKTHFPILFGGSELVVAGVLDKEFPVIPKVTGCGIDGCIDLVPEVKRPVTRLERLWAYLTVQQLLDARDIADNKTEYEKKALDLALKYSFVTPVSSLVVVKPNSTDASVEPTAADKSGSDALHYPSYAFAIPASGFIALSAPLGGAPAPYYPTTPFLAGAPGVLSIDHTDRLSEDFDSEITQDEFTTAAKVQPHISLESAQPSTPKTEPTELEVLTTNLPWLNTSLTTDGSIHTSTGDFKLGLNETSTDDIVCPSSPMNGSGYCKLLHECPEVHFLLTNIHIFQQFICDMNGFAAVCCPPPKVH